MEYNCLQTAHRAEPANHCLLPPGLCVLKPRTSVLPLEHLHASVHLSACSLQASNSIPDVTDTLWPEPQL